MSRVAQNIAKYAIQEFQEVQFRERDVFDMIYHGLIEDCPVSTHDTYRAPIMWNKSLGLATSRVKGLDVHHKR